MITPEETKNLCGLIFQISGIHIEPAKSYLLENRLTPLLSQYKCVNFTELHSRAVTDHTGSVKHGIVDAISTNETFFFRDKTPFVLLQQKIIPDILKRRKHKSTVGPVPLRFWSAACSTGQEVYSIAMTMLEMLPGPGNSISIFGTDISDNAISRASTGQFSDYEVERGLPVHMRNKFFHKVNEGWQIKDEVRTMAQFAKINLTKPFPALGQFDVIFCRNVAIYFNEQDKINLFKKLASVLKPDGALILGGSENLSSLDTEFIAFRHQTGIFYQLKSLSEDDQAQKAAAGKGARSVPKPNLKKKCTTSFTPKVPVRPIPDRKKSDQQPPLESCVPVSEEPAEILVENSGYHDVEDHLKTGERKEYDPLLAGLHSRQENKRSSLLDGKHREKEKKRSLLDKIHSADEEDTEK